MPLALPVVAVGILALVLALILAVLLTPVIEGLAREVPVVGGYIGRGLSAAVDWAVAKFKAYARTFTVPVTRWLGGLADGARGLAEAAALFAVALVEQLDHLTHVTVHEIVHAFVNPIRALAHDAAATAEQAQAGVDVLARELGGELRGIEGEVAKQLDHLRDLVRNVDLPALGRDLGDVIGQVERDAVGRIGDLRHYSDAEFGRLWDQLGKLPLEQLLLLLAAFPATAALVNVIADEAGLGRPECRSKVRAICATDPRAWETLLAIVVPLFAFPGMREIVRLGEGLIELARPLIHELGEAG